MTTPDVSPAVGHTPLTETEKKQIAFQLGPLLTGAGLLALGFVYSLLFPDQRTVSSAIQAAAAVIVSIPIFTQAIQGFVARPTKDLTEQLVALAILAAMASGDFVTATLVPLFLELGHLFEERSSRGARAAIEGIRKLRAHRATVLRDGSEREVSPDDVELGDVVVVRPGEVIPCDGEVESGYSSVDQAPITGESHYEDVSPGSTVFSGTVNLGGLLRLKTTGVGTQTVLGRVVELLKQVEESKTPVIRLLERYAGAYLPFVLAMSALTLYLTGELDRAITVLIVACPCALVLAGPAAMVASMTATTRQGILIKSSSFLESAAEVETLILDKTGTVTAGVLSVSQVCPAPGRTERDVLLAAARCGYGSLHPISRAVVREVESRGLEFSAPDDVREVPGEGVVGTSGETTWRLGRRTWLEGEDVAFGSWSDELDGSGPGAWVSEDGEAIGLLVLVDRPREDAIAALDEMRELGIDRLVLLTGDRQAEAAKVAAQLGFDDYVAEVLPEQKLDIVRREQERGPVMMVGDGVNDALALSGADVGVAVGARINEVALGGADVALMTNDLERLPRMMRLAEQTRAVIIQNALLGTAFSVGMLGLASAGVVSPLVGALLHNGGSLFVIMNSSRLLRYIQEHEEYRAWRRSRSEAARLAKAA